MGWMSKWMCMTRMLTSVVVSLLLLHAMECCIGRTRAGLDEPWLNCSYPRTTETHKRPYVCRLGALLWCMTRSVVSRDLFARGAQMVRRYPRWTVLELPGPYGGVHVQAKTQRNQHAAARAPAQGRGCATALLGFPGGEQIWARGADSERRLMRDDMRCACPVAGGRHRR